MRQLIRTFIFCLLFLAQQAWGGSLALILSESGGTYDEFASKLSDALGGSNWNIVSTTLADATQAPPTADLIVTVGSDALRKALSRTDSPPIVATLLPRLSYERILSEHRRSGRITAIYLDQPAARQAAKQAKDFAAADRCGGGPRLPGEHPAPRTLPSLE